VRLATRVLLLLIACFLLGLTPVAFADPPDLTWLGGYWDDDDSDNVVVFILSAYAVVALAVWSGPWWMCAALVEPPYVRAIPARVVSSTAPRAPPLDPSRS
jgi:hypothetical protein